MGLLQDGMARAQQRLIEPLPTAERKVFMTLLSKLVDANNQYCRTIVKGM
jgi:hypothetical protein